MKYLTGWWWAIPGPGCLTFWHDKTWSGQLSTEAFLVRHVWECPTLARKGTKALQMAAFGGLYRGQDAGHGPSYFTTMDKKGPECISACQVVMDPGPVYIICEACLDNTEKVFWTLQIPNPTLLAHVNIRPAPARARPIGSEISKWVMISWLTSRQYLCPIMMSDGCPLSIGICQETRNIGFSKN